MQITPAMISPTVTEICLSSIFNESITFIPNTITHLTLGHNFNQPIHYLPPPLISFETGHQFNQPISCLPALLTHLKFGENFKSSPNPLPPNLKHLIFCTFDGPLDYLPSHLLFLDLGSKFSHLLPQLPQSLTHFYFRNYEYQHIIDARECALTHIQYFPSKVLIPTTVVHVEAYEFNEDLLKLPLVTFLSINSCDIVVYEDTTLWPPNLIELQINFCDNEAGFVFDSLPLNLKTLKLATCEIYESELDINLGHLPPSLTYVEFPWDFDRTINYQLTSLTSLTSLILGHEFNHSIDNLPSSLTFLELGHKFNKPISQFPSSLTKFNLHSICFSSSICKFPSCFEVLSLFRPISTSISVNSGVSILIYNTDCGKCKYTSKIVNRHYTHYTDYQ